MLDPLQLNCFGGLQTDLPSKITVKFDWLSLMLDHHSIADVFDFFFPVSDLNYEIVGKSLEALYMKYTTGLGLSCCIELPWFNLYIPGDDLIDLNNSDFFTADIRRFKVDCSGKCLDVIRSETDIESLLFGFNLPQGFRMTRVDIAFDYINYKPTILNDLCNFCMYHSSDKGYIGIAGRDSVMFEISSGSKEMLRLGGESSPDKLVIYNKLLEQSKKAKEAEEIEALSGIDSWIRFEWRMRGKKIYDFIRAYSFRDPQTCYAALFDHWQMRDQTPPNGRAAPPVSQEWLDLFEYDRSVDIIQNANFSIIAAPLPTFEKIEEDSSRWISSVFALIAKKGSVGFIQFIQDKYNNLNRSSLPSDRLCKHRILNRTTNAAILDGCCSLEDLPGIEFDEYGFVELK